MYTGLPYCGVVKKMIRYRNVVLAIAGLLILWASFTAQHRISLQDQLLWINGSSAYNTLIREKYPAYCVEKIDVDLSGNAWSPQTVEQLRDFERQLRSVEGVKEIHSLFESKQVVNHKLSEAQQMVEVTSLRDVNNSEVYETLRSVPPEYAKYFDGTRATFYIMSSKPAQFDDLTLSMPYEITNGISDENFNEVIIFIILLVILVVAYTFIFKSLLPSILGALFIYATGVLTVAIFELISSVSVTHISILLVAMTISVMDFTYIYYKWHVLQKQFSSHDVIYRVIIKTITPIFWTSIITMVGIGSLAFVDSHILYSIGMNVLLSAVTGFVLSFTMLPALLSFFSIKNPSVIKDPAHYFATREAHYHKQALKIFMIASLVVFGYALYSYLSKPITVESSINNHQIKAVLDRKGFDHEQLMELRWIEQELHEAFSGVKRVTSAYSMIRSIYETEHPETPFVLRQEEIDSYLFSIDLYGLKDSLMDHGALGLYIDLDENQSKTEVLRFLKDKGLIFQDRSSLLSLAKIESIATLWYVVFFVLFLIMAVVYTMTRLYVFALIALFVNAIPLVWFFSAIHFFNIPLSTEILVAMIVTVALSSDATLHFIHYYHDNRHKPRNAELALESSFLYVGMPLGMGNIILALTFASLIFVPVEMIFNIGLYSSLLIVLSLLTDIFILPVLFLWGIKANRAIKDYDHTI